eukprot:652290-Hanusia_phi.AAC.1
MISRIGPRRYGGGRRASERPDRTVGRPGRLPPRAWQPRGTRRGAARATVRSHHGITVIRSEHRHTARPGDRAGRTAGTLGPTVALSGAPGSVLSGPPPAQSVTAVAGPARRLSRVCHRHGTGPGRV